MTSFQALFDDATRPRDRKPKLSDSDKNKVYALIGHVSRINLDKWCGHPLNIVHAERVAALARQGFKMARQLMNDKSAKIQAYSEEKHYLANNPEENDPYITTKQACRLWTNLAPLYQFGWIKGVIGLGPLIPSWLILACSKPDSRS